MSTSEFDEQSTEKENDLKPLSHKERGSPDDFSEEDVAFAQELKCLFSLPDEEVPPYFVQTLLEAENPRFQAVEQGFEQKTSARVFRRLKLHRRLFHRSRTPIRSSGGILPPRRPVIALVAACMLFALATMITTGNSFAAGMAILLSSQHSGVIQVNTYPKELVTPVAQKQVSRHRDHAVPQQRSLLSIEQQLAFPMYWPASLPDNYSFSSVSILNGSNQLWADGPIIQLNYNYLIPGVKAHGSGRIAIREFKPTGQVLQVVQAGAARQITIGNNSSGQVAIYVDGQWGQRTKVSQAWVYGARSELIYEHNGVIFWIVGDQRDGINGTVLQNIAASMASFNATRALRIDDNLDVMLDLEDMTWLFSGDVIYLDGPDGTSWSVEGQPSLVNSISRNHMISTNNP
ncbi:MAG: hypothetical protein H0V70_23820 [Ktedonobacteraceae bacterium]|nr:hypothetical protein [Ktedonobacteraceae bacterium]